MSSLVGYAVDKKASPALPPYAGPTRVLVPLPGTLAGPLLLLLSVEGPRRPGFRSLRGPQEPAGGYARSLAPRPAVRVSADESRAAATLDSPLGLLEGLVKNSRSPLFRVPGCMNNGTS